MTKFYVSYNVTNGTITNLYNSAIDDIEITNGIFEITETEYENLLLNIENYRVNTISKTIVLDTSSILINTRNKKLWILDQIYENAIGYMTISDYNKYIYFDRENVDIIKNYIMVSQLDIEQPTMRRLKVTDIDDRSISFLNFSYPNIIELFSAYISFCEYKQTTYITYKNNIDTATTIEELNNINISFSYDCGAVE